MPIDRRRRRNKTLQSRAPQARPSWLLLIIMMVPGIAFRSTQPIRKQWRTTWLSAAGTIYRQMSRLSSHGLPSPVETREIKGRHVFIKRDDKLDLFGQGIHGNKARKLYFLGRLQESELPDVFMSFGGLQSNAMAALAGMVCGQLKRPMIYCTKGSIPSWLKAKPSGNYQRALELGVEFRELSREAYVEYFESVEDEEAISPPVKALGLPPSSIMVVPQGGAIAGAEKGVKMLAQEIGEFWQRYCSSSEALGRDAFSLAVVLPSGTGTTAYFLAKHLQQQQTSIEGRVPSSTSSSSSSIHVYAIPCCGDGDYLSQQMTRLGARTTGASPQVGGSGGLPTILEGTRKSTFAKPDPALLAMWQDLKAEGLLVDLIYAPYAWRVMLVDRADCLWGRFSHIMYIHTGGLEGLSSQLARYKHLGLLTQGL